MRIKKIEIQNFRAFYGNFEIDLGGKNLLLYGENGSGKSSLFYALKLFLESLITSCIIVVFLQKEEGQCSKYQ